MFSRGFRLAVLDFHQTNREKIHKKTHHTKNRARLPLPSFLAAGLSCWCQAITDIYRICWCRRRWWRCRSRSIGASQRWNAKEPFGWCGLSVVFCFSLMKNSFLQCLLIIGFTDVLNTFHQIFLSQKKNNSTWKYDQYNTKNLQGATHTDYYYPGEKYTSVGYIQVEPWGTPPGLGTATVRTDPGWTPSWTEVVTLWPEYQVS